MSYRWGIVLAETFVMSKPTTFQTPDPRRTGVFVTGILSMQFIGVALSLGAPATAMPLLGVVFVVCSLFAFLLVPDDVRGAVWRLWFVVLGAATMATTVACWVSYVSGVRGTTIQLVGDASTVLGIMAMLVAGAAILSWP